MNWDQLEGKWRQLEGRAKQKWSKLTDDDFGIIRGQRQQLIGMIQERYGIAKDVAEKQADEFIASLSVSDDEDTAESERPQTAGQRQ